MNFTTKDLWNDFKSGTRAQQAALVLLALSCLAIAVCLAVSS